MNMCLLEVTMCEKCRSSHFQSEWGSKKCENWGVKKFYDWGGGLTIWGGLVLLGGGQCPITCHGKPSINQVKIKPKLKEK